MLLFGSCQAAGYLDCPSSGGIIMRSVFTLIAVMFAAGLAGYCPAQDINEVGLYVDEDAMVPFIDLTTIGMFDAFIVLKNPQTLAGEPVASIFGFEMLLSYDSSLMFLASIVFPTDALNIGTPEEIICGFGHPVLVGSDNLVTLAMVSFLYISDQQFIYIGPVSVPSLPGEMAYLGEDYLDLFPMYPSSGSHEAPVFAVNGTVVAVEKESWGNVKALYR
jgi:hypothetical protein